MSVPNTSGRACSRMTASKGTFTRSFSVEAYKTATFEVGGKLVSTGPVVRKGEVKAEVNATYLYGAPVRSGDVDIAVHSRPRRVSFRRLSRHGASLRLLHRRGPGTRGLSAR